MKQTRHIAVFTAPWCGACKALKPVLEGAREDGIDVVELDVSDTENMELANSLLITSLPTLVGFDGGEAATESVVGAVGKERIVELYNSMENN